MNSLVLVKQTFLLYGTIVIALLLLKKKKRIFNF